MISSLTALSFPVCVLCVSSADASDDGADTNTTSTGGGSTDGKSPTTSIPLDTVGCVLTSPQQQPSSLSVLHLSSDIDAYLQI